MIAMTWGQPDGSGHVVGCGQGTVATGLAAIRLAIEQAVPLPVLDQQGGQRE